MKKDSLVKGTIILTVAALVARLLGVVQKVPLVYLLGDGGMATYLIAFSIYSVLLVVATAGVPSALSKLIAEQTALGRYAEASRIYRAAVYFALASGLIMTLVLWYGAPYQAIQSNDPHSVLAIRALAPAMLVFPLIAVMRGYFQGRQNMMPNGLSQIVEQIFRVMTAVGLAYLFLVLSYEEEIVVAGASFGGVMGSIGAVAVMLWFAFKLHKADERERELTKGPSGAKASDSGSSRFSYKEIYARLFRVSVPIVIFSVAVTLIYYIDASITINLLEGQMGYELAKDTLGVLGGRGQSLAGIPIILAIALSQSIVPIISGAYSQGEMKRVSHQTTRVMQLSILSGLPMVLMICIAARPLNGFIFGYETKLATGYIVAIIVFLTISAMFQIVMQTSGAVLMGLSQMRALIYSVIIGIIIKLAASFGLAPWLGIHGIIAGTLLCFLIMGAYNLRVLRKHVNFTILGSRWFRLAWATVLLIVSGVGLEWLTNHYLHLFTNQRLNDMISSVIVCGYVVLLYPLLLIAARVVTKDDLENMPGSIKKIVNIVNRFRRK